jgi:hypothetical protein
MRWRLRLHHHVRPRRRRAGAARLVLAGAVVAGAGGAARAGDYSSGGTFLPIGHGARGHALGGAVVASTRDDAAAYWNPANLNWSPLGTGITLMHAEILPGIESGYETVTLGRTAGRRLGPPDQVVQPAQWGYGLFFSHLGIDFEAGGWSENALQLSAAWAINNFASVGAGLKALRVTNPFEDGNGSGAGLDVGLGVLLTERLTLALVARDLWTRVDWGTDKRETLASTLHAGAELRPARAWSTEADVVLREGRVQRWMAGAEWNVVDGAVALRAGWTSILAGEPRVWPSVGAGVRYARFGVDYAASFDREDALDIGQRVSLRVRF